MGLFAIWLRRQPRRIYIAHPNTRSFSKINKIFFEPEHTNICRFVISNSQVASSSVLFQTSDSKRLPVKYSSQSDFESLDFDIDWPRGLDSLVLTKRNAASGNEIGCTRVRKSLDFANNSLELRGLLWVFAHLGTSTCRSECGLSKSNYVASLSMV